MEVSSWWRRELFKQHPSVPTYMFVKELQRILKYNFFVHFSAWELRKINDKRNVFFETLKKNVSKNFKKL